MIKNEYDLIWETFVSEQASPEFTEFHSDDKTHDFEGEEPGLVTSLEDEEGSTSNLDKLIAMATSDSDEEEREDNENLDVTIDDGTSPQDRRELGEI